MFDTDVLELIYDKVSLLDSNRCVVLSGRTLKVINLKNDTLFEVSKCMDYWLGVKGRIYVMNEESFIIQCYDSTTFKRKKSLDCFNIQTIRSKGFIIESLDGEKELINSDGNTLIPGVRGTMYLARSTSVADWIRVKPYGHLLTDNFGWGEVRVDKEYTRADGIFALTTQIVGIDVVYTSKTYDSSKVRLRNNGVLVGKEYSSILPRRALISQGLVQVFKEKNLSHDNTTGYIDFNGNEIVEPIYDWVEFIGNGITITKTDKGYGTLVNGKVIINNGDINECFVTKTGVPMHTTIVKGIQFYIGNDGHAYSDVRMAFPIYKSTVDNNVYLMCLYGNWIYIDKDFNLINRNKLSAEIQCKTNWVKL